MMNKKVSLKDIASYLGVSTALVSYVINNKEKEARVSAEMAKKIRKAATKLNYQPNLIFFALVGLLLPKLKYLPRLKEAPLLCVFSVGF